MGTYLPDPTVSLTQISLLQLEALLVLSSGRTEKAVQFPFDLFKNQMYVLLCIKPDCVLSQRTNPGACPEGVYGSKDRGRPRRGGLSSDQSND